MTIGISKEMLLEYRRLRLDSEELLDRLIDECTELNPWIPVDDNTPKDKWLLCFIDFLEKQYIQRLDKKTNSWYGQDLVQSPTPTHWKELADDPK